MAIFTVLSLRFRLPDSVRRSGNLGQLGITRHVRDNWGAVANLSGLVNAEAYGC